MSVLIYTMGLASPTQDHVERKASQDINPIGTFAKMHDFRI
jgi:hypothetical protein